jgi:aryl-alcohol dehydrogenase-like predicted oxidoreductase
MTTPNVSRRDFLQAGAAAGLAAATVPAIAAGEPLAGDTAKPKPLVPKRKLGKTGVEVSMLNQGTSFSLNERHFNLMHEEGIRYIDTAKMYVGGASERTIGDWFEKYGHRKDYFLVTKHAADSPEDWIKTLDGRLEALKTDYVDLYFIHAVGGRRGKGDEGRPADKAWAAAADKIRKSGKARFCGFSTHCGNMELRTVMLENAAKGGWVDALMVATNPQLMREDKNFNAALDKCHKADVGLISMKECKDANSIKKVVPDFEKKGLTAVTAVLTAVWTDERFASICSAMDNVKKLRENADAARNFKPMTKKELALVDDMLRSVDRLYCAGCDGRCREAAGTQADLNSIARYVSYVEEQGQLAEARALFAAMPPEARDWTGADLKAASAACKCRLDFERIMKTAERRLA